MRFNSERKAASWPVGVDHLKVLATELPNLRALREAR